MNAGHPGTSPAASPLRGRGGARASGRGVVLVGQVWTGGAAAPFEGAVIVGAAGLVEQIVPGMLDELLAGVPSGLAILGRPGAWVGPGVIDAHVHLGLARPPAAIGPGLVAVRDLGSPLDVLERIRPLRAPERGRWRRRVRSWRRRPASVAPATPLVAIGGPILTAPGGYPSTSWGAGTGVSSALASPAQARLAVRSLAARGVDFIKVALEPTAANLPTLNRAMLAAIVHAAHDAGLPVVAHALRARMVARAVDTGVDELAHTPTERLDDSLVERIVGSRIAVVSTLQAFFSGGEGADAAANAAALVRAGATLRYGTDLGVPGTVPGVDPRELDRLAHAGLGRWGALRAATEGSAGAAGIRGVTGMIQRGAPAAMVLLDGDPVREPALWRAPLATVLGPSVVAVPAAAGPADGAADAPDRGTRRVRLVHRMRA